MKKELKAKWLEIQGSPDACVITGALCEKRDGKECYCTAGFLLKAAGYKPVFSPWEAPIQSSRYWVSPSRHRILNPGRAVTRLLKGTGQDYGSVWAVNDDTSVPRPELLEFIKSLPVEA